MSGIISAGGGGANPLGDAVDVSEFEGITTGSYLRGKSDGTLEERTATQARSDLGAVAKAGDTMTGPLNRQVATVSASATQTQGGGTTIAADITRITVCATAGDACTLRAAVAGAVAVVKNEGAEAGQIFPASGEDLGVGANTAVAIAVGQTRAWRCLVAGTWQPVDVAWMPVLLTDLTEGDVLQLVSGVFNNRSLLAAGLARTVSLIVTGPSETLTTGDGKVVVRIPASINGRSLTQVAAALVGSGSSSGAVTIQVRKVGVGDLLSTALTIDESETDTLNAETPAVIVSNGNEVMATGDLLAVDVDGAGTGAAGLVLDLIF